MGNCYELTGLWVLDYPEWTFVGGEIEMTRESGRNERVEHAWAENEAQVYDPTAGRVHYKEKWRVGQLYDKLAWYALHSPVVKARYGSQEASRMATLTGVWGDWWNWAAGRH
jgi:hypothetical protein